MRWRPGARAAYVAWLALLAVAYCAFPGQRVAVWALIGLSGTAAIVAGVAVNRPAGRAPWLLLAGASLMLAVGQVSFLAARAAPGAAVLPRGAVALAAYPLAVAGLLGFLRWRGPGQDRRGLLDGLILGTGLGLAAWLYLVLPYSRGLTAPEMAVALAYPLGDVLLLMMLARLLVPSPARAGAARLLALGAAGLLASDAWYCVSRLHGSVHPGALGVLGWAVCYAAWGAAALSPAMTGLTEPVLRPADVTAARLMPLLVAALLVPGVLLAAAVQRRLPDAGVIAVAAVVLDLLILARLADAAAAHRRAAARDRMLRETATSFAAAATLDEIASATRAAATSLTGPYARAALVALRNGDGFIPLGADDPYEADLDATVRAWLPTLAAPGPHLVPAASPAGSGGRQGVLVCPLPAAAAALRLAGVLALFGDARTLAGLPGAVELLAGQTARAIDRILLTRDTGRREGEAYFRTLVQDTSEVILVVGDDGIVRSASPSAAKIFGEVSVAGEHLWDLVRPEERDTVIGSFTRMRDQAIASAPKRWPRSPAPTARPRSRSASATCAGTPRSGACC